MRHCILAATAASLLSGTAAVAANPAKQVVNDPPILPVKGPADRDGLTITGSARIRLDAIDGQFRPTASKSDVLLSLRTTLLAEYRHNWLVIGGELMDSRTYLQDDRSSIGTTEVNALEPIQAYVGLNLRDALGEGSKSELTVGRFTQDIGSRRLVSRQAFRNSTNAYAGARFTYANRGGDKAILIWTMPQVRLPSDRGAIFDNKVELDRQTTDIQLYGGSFTKAHVGRGTVELYAYGLSERDAPGYQTKNRRLFTPGIRWASVPLAGHLDHDLEAIYQHGRTRASSSAADLTDLSVSAYAFHAEAGYSFASAWKPRIALQYDRASGDKANPRTYNRFDFLYGARRFEFGPTSLYGAINRSNISSPGVRLEAIPTKRLDGYVMYRPFWLDGATDTFSATEIRDRTGRSGSFAGHQIDGRLRYWLKPKALRLESGFAYLAKGRFLRDAPNATYDGDTKYVYTDLTYTF